MVCQGSSGITCATASLALIAFVVLVYTAGAVGRLVGKVQQLRWMAAGRAAAVAEVQNPMMMAHAQYPVKPAPAQSYPQRVPPQPQQQMYHSQGMPQQQMYYASR